MFLKRSFLTALLPLLFISMLIAACGSQPTTTGSGSTPTATTAPISAAAVVKTASATVAGKTETILTNAQGMTLYYLTTDSATSVCSGACAQNWPPLLFTGSGTPTSATTLTGTLATATNTNGTQVTYQGHPLYTFIADKAPGDTKGQGVKNIWFVATPDLKSAASNAAPTPTKTNGY